ncbi:MAG: hypothetical protein AAGC44_03720 [Planctomycetota bacterium]
MSRLTHDHWYRAVREEARRDANVELIITVEGADGQPLRKVYKSRVFGIKPDGTMLAERSDAAMMDNALAVGDKVAVMVINHGQRLMVQSRVLEVVLHRVNDSLRLTCYRLKKGEQVRIDQRRSFFRAKSATSDHAEIKVRSGDPDTHWSMKALLVNVGGGGIGVVLKANRRTMAEVQSYSRLVAELHIGSESKDAEITTRLAHIAPIDECRLYLGLEYVLPEGKAGDDLQDRMVQYAAWLQRQSLKKRRA